LLAMRGDWWVVHSCLLMNRALGVGMGLMGRALVRTHEWSCDQGASIRTSSLASRAARL